jgi:hypothetical protein
MPASGIKTAEAPSPLSEPERKQLEELLARASQSPNVRIGDPYIALINLSVPRRLVRGVDGKEPDNATELVMAGDTVWLTEEEAAKYLRHGPRDGRQVAVIRRATGAESSQLAPQRVPPRAVSGRLNAPPPPGPGDEGPRPDPPGSSQIQYMQPADVPEAAEPVAGSENSIEQDAVDIPPRSRTRTPAR